MTLDPVCLLEVEVVLSFLSANTEKEIVLYCRLSIHVIRTNRLLRKGTAIPVSSSREKYSPGPSQRGHV